MNYPTEVVNDVAKIAVKVVEFLNTLPENQGDAYVAKVTFGLYNEPYENVYVGPNEHGGYSLYTEGDSK